MKKSISFLTFGLRLIALATAVFFSGCMTIRPSAFTDPEVLKSEEALKIPPPSADTKTTKTKGSAQDSDFFSDQAVANEIAQADGEFLKEAREVSAASAEDTATPHRIPVEVNQEVKKWIHFFTVTDRKRFQRFLERGALYKDIIQSILRKNGVPKELYYLGMIESGYDLHARSHARAVGPWQFISGTGRRYGLMQTHEVDERRDIVRSTEAAAQYLRGLYTAFQSWYLAMAGYNAGEGRVLSAVVRGGTRNFWELVDQKALPPETRSYVPKFLAAMIIGRNPERYGFKKVNPHDPFPEVDSLQVLGGVSFSQISKKTGVSIRKLSELNPHLLKKRTPSNLKCYAVWVPKGVLSSEALNETQWNSEVRHRNIASKALVSTKKKIHVVRKGETLHTIASRYGTTVKKVKKVNRIKSSQIRVGKRLQILPVNYRSGS